MSLGMFSPPVVVCEQCEGEGRALTVCRCVRMGDRFLIDANAERTVDGRAYQGCELCKGSGYLTYDCDSCRATGRQRGQLVLTVVNLDTGVTRSANVVPGGVEPRRNAGGRWELALSPIVAALAAEVGAVEYRDAYGLERKPCELTVMLPADWRPDLPVADRQRLEGAAIARLAWQPWRLYCGRSTPTPDRDLPAELSRLCHLADLLSLDLVVEARRAHERDVIWEIRYELPGGAVPVKTRRWANDLSAAIAATSVSDAMFGLVERARTAPAHYLRPHPAHRAGPPTIDVDQVERRIHADLDGIGGRAPGAQAIWRDGRWQHTRLQVEDQVEVMTEEATGQVVRSSVTLLARAWEPPAPGWQDELIPYGPCPDCDPEHRLRPCLCTLANQPPDPNCPGCSGAGVAPTTMPCPTCGDSHRVHQGLVLTMTDLDEATLHVNWLVPDQVIDVPLVATQPGGKPVFQLPLCYQLDHWAMNLGGRPADLTYLDGGHEVGQDLCEGTVTVDHPEDDPLARYLVNAGGGHPAGRLLVCTAPPAAPPLTELVRLALGLHQTLVVTLEDHRLDEDDPTKIHGEGWGIELIPPDRPMPADPKPYQRSPQSAAACFLEYLGNAAHRVVPDDPRQGIPVPQTPEPPPAVEDPIRLIRHLARHLAGRPVSIRYHLGGCHLYVHEYGGARHLASARTVPIALTALGLGLGRDQS
ncbi:hypothetical protein GCM10027280_59910 [Micromonospora polyrhachis]|uniref:Uncharacterized protein n=1 Tax=Micromonospora polyrhachis TaxID=1282883 RepID=A0A7W7SNA4_9ACTN|nr:hypothetical protein [Micromonospora polyrhachis]MBB4957909.1 hypothetical protein [Micromonospora polyrhachis]